MSAQSNALKLITTANTRKNVTPRSGLVQEIQQLSTMWNATTAQNRCDWKTLCQTPGFGTAVAVPSKASGYSLFIGINTNAQGREHGL